MYFELKHKTKISSKSTNNIINTELKIIVEDLYFCSDISLDIATGKKEAAIVIISEYVGVIMVYKLIPSSPTILV